LDGGPNQRSRYRIRHPRRDLSLAQLRKLLVRSTAGITADASAAQWYSTSEQGAGDRFVLK
jgi:hypothetical protein